LVLLQLIGLALGHGIVKQQPSWAQQQQLRRRLASTSICSSNFVTATLSLTPPLVASGMAICLSLKASG